MAVTFRPWPWLSAICLAALALLLWLGGWQWGRFLDKRNAAPPQSIEISGRVALDRVVFVYAILDGVTGWRVFAPVHGQDMAFADVAFVPGLQPPERASLAGVGGIDTAHLRGVRVTPRPPGPFVPPSRPEQGVFYAVELPAMAAAVGLERVPGRYIAGDYHGAPNPFLRVGTPPERHLGYALTWWGLAAGLVGVYAAIHWSRGRLRIEWGGA